MKSLIAVLLIPLFLFTGCAGLTGSDVAERVLAGATCLAALAGAGVQVAGDPLLSGAVTATNVLTAISSIGGSNLPGTVMQACQSTIDYASKDAAGLTALLKNQKPAATATPPAARKAPAALIAKPVASPEPSVVKIPIR